MDTFLRDIRRQARWHIKSWFPAVIVATTMIAWEWSASSGRLSALFFPAPSVVVMTIVRLFRSGELVTHTRATLLRVVFGLVLGGVPGLLVGLAMGWWRPLREALDPLVAALHPLPKIAVLPLIMIIFGIGESSKIVAIAVGTFFPMLINSMAGVRQISPIHFEVAENYGASPFKVLTRVVIPGSLPLVLVGARLALNIALLFTIAVELVSAREGLGEMIWLAWQTMRTEELYASLAVIGALGIGFNLLLQYLAKRSVPWHVEREV
jgi:ABC-type nitrate/sulfonate/bicarbonate transport system permease component